ncbi:MAG: patatin-like phospholipase family protein, partial [Gammaproteobacteria bacterium]|nr:patatin-like phospholipase family protein [Gammaproteobacteria bacterium]
HEHKPVVDLHYVLNAILASSAFPVTFSPIEMNYCKAVTDSSSPSANCPAGYRAHQDSFIDGGNFDNAPIGAAMRINDVEGFYEDANIVFVNPGKRRNRERKLKAETQSQYENSQLLPGIKEYLGLSYHIFDYGMSAELYQTARRVEQLQRQSNSSRPSINVTDRYYPIVGGYLMHFGAFFDRAFREYDFIVGVYDGVVGIAESECKSRVKTLNRSDYYDCVGIEAKKVFAHVELNADNEISLFEKLARREFGAAVDSLAWAWLLDINRPISKKKSRTENNPLLSVFYSISRNHCSSNTVVDQCADPIKEKYFDQFLINLKHQDPALAGFEEHTRQVVNGESEWKHSLLDTAVNRLYAIERKKYKQAKDEKDPFLAQKNVFDILKMSTYVGKTYFLKNSTGLWPNSTKDSSRFSASKMLPDEIGISYRQTSVYLKYKTEIKIADLNIVDENLPMGFETRFMPIDWASRTTKANKMLGAEFVLKAHISNPLISTLGFGYGYYNVDFFGHSPDGKLNSFTTPLHGAIIDLGAVAGKIKVSFIYRGSEINADNRGYVNWAVNLGLSDVKGLLWLW